jgi:hypothetical protein
VPYSNSIACSRNFKLSTPTIVWKADIFQGSFNRLVRLDAKSPVDEQKLYLGAHLLTKQGLDCFFFQLQPTLLKFTKNLRHLLLSGNLAKVLPGVKEVMLSFLLMAIMTPTLLNGSPEKGP